MADRPVFLFTAVYNTADDARADYEALVDAHAAGLVGTYDAAVIMKGSDGKVHVHKREKPTQHGAWTGIAIGAVAGVIFPPSILGTAVVGGAAGGVIGHLRGGMSRTDLKELGQVLDNGQAGLVIIGESRIEEQLDKALERAAWVVEKQLDADADELRRELDEAAKEEAKG